MHSGNSEKPEAPSEELLFSTLAISSAQKINPVVGPMKHVPHQPNSQFDFQPEGSEKHHKEYVRRQVLYCYFIN